MAFFDPVIRELANKFSLGGRAGALVMELLRNAANERSGGLAGFIDRFKKAGLEDLAASWIGRGENRPLTAAQMEAALGGAVIGRIAAKVGLPASAAMPAMAFVVPKLIDKLTPNGTIPATLPPEAAAFVTAGAAPVRTAASASATTTKTQRSVTGVRTASGVGAASPEAAAQSRGGGFFRKLLPLLGLALLGMLAYWLINPLAEQTAKRVTTPAAQTGAQLSVRNTDGSASDAGVAADQQTGTAISTDDAEARATREATERSLSALNALPSGYSASAMTNALNVSIIRFATGSAQLSTESMDYLREAAKVIKGAPAGAVIEVGGHTDAVGDAAMNDRLSQARAESVREALIGYGVEPAMLTARGYGGSRPVAGNDTPEDRFQNRRIEFTIVN